MPTERTTELVLTGVEADGQSVLVIPFGWALAELATFAALQHATTFGEARSEPGAAAVIEAWLPTYLANAEDETERPADDEPWDAEEYFGTDYWRAWRPEPRQTTVQFLSGVPEVLALLRPDTGWGFDHDPYPLLHVGDRDVAEAALRELGHEVRQWQGLAEAYLDAPTDPARLLASLLAGEG